MVTKKKTKTTFKISYVDITAPGEVVRATKSSKKLLKHMFCKLGQTHYSSDGSKLIVVAKKPMTVWITKAIIASANRRDARGCAVAMAIRKALGPQYAVRVHQTSVVIWDMETMTEIRFRLPSYVSAAIKRFDKGQDWDLPVGAIELLPYRTAAKTKSKADKPSRKAPRVKIIEVTGKLSTSTTVIKIKRRKRSLANRARTVTRSSNLGRKA